MLLVFSIVLKYHRMPAVVQPSPLVEANRPSSLEVQNPIVRVWVSNLRDRSVKFTRGAMGRDDAIAMVNYTPLVVFHSKSLTRHLY